MTSKKWFITFIISWVVVVMFYALMNIIIDPFGVFGDKFFDWNSYDYTKNPKVAKITYLNKKNEQYDSYIIGGSTSSAYSVDKLNDYLDASFYNLFSYGCDLFDDMKTVSYVINHYEVKNIVLPIGLREMVSINTKSNDYTDNLHAEVDQSSLMKFYGKYLFASYRYSLEKMNAVRSDSYFQKSFDVFDVRTGAYDKTVRDVTPIQDKETYLSNNSQFMNYPQVMKGLPYTEEALSCVEQIKAMCEAQDINLIIIFSPEYYPELADYDKTVIREFMSDLSEITEFWDFAYSTLSYDERFFYDPTHIRNALGDMVLARIFGDESLYVPENLGVFIAEGSGAVASYSIDNQLSASNDYIKQVPILMYHHIAYEGSDSTTISPENFEAHIKALVDNGYEALSFKQLMDYVYYGADLPQKPIVITMDDGYQSNYDVAFPILQQYNMKAAIFVIGTSIGKTTYKETGNPILPHFDYHALRLMYDSGLIEIQTHSYDMHQYEPYEDESTFRSGVLQRADEMEEAYIKAFKDDYLKAKADLEANGVSSYVYSYPFGMSTTESEVLLREMGIKVTLGTMNKTNEIIKGLPQSLLQLNRMNVYGSSTSEDLIDSLSHLGY